MGGKAGDGTDLNELETRMRSIKRALCAVWLAAGLTAAMAQAPEAAIRKNLAARLPQLPTVDEISKTPMAGIFEVRVGSDLLYTDADANFLFQGNMIDIKLQRNLTEERLEKLLAIDFAALPIKDAFTVVRGNGKRKVAVFQDPNCPYCKRFERDLQQVDNITVYMFLYPILGQDSNDKARNLWCAKDKSKAWQDWMLRNQAAAAANCDTAAVARNVEFGKNHKITGTPTLLFPGGARVPGAVDAQQVEKYLAAAKQ
jgi:thiol:disulfide interchange protein DsbC